MLPTVLMTRHNLDSHISWLLSRKVTPPSGVHARAPTNSTRGDPVSANPVEEEAEQEIRRAPPSPPQHRGAAQVVNAVRAFARPALPASVTAKSQLQESRQVLTDESMGKLSSATRSTRPGLMSQHQLATPASTTSSTAASYTSHTSLNSNYVTFLKEGQGWLESFIAVVETDVSRLPFVKTICESDSATKDPQISADPGTADA